MAQPPPYQQDGSAYPPPSLQGAAYPQAPPQGAAYPPHPSQTIEGPPPPAYVYQDPNMKPSQPNVVVVQNPPPRKKTGLFGSFMNEVDKVGKQIGKELDYAADKVNQAIDKNYSSNLLNLFCNNNSIQLIPRSSQKTVQILLNPQGHMQLDGNGPLDPRPFNSSWLVTNEGNNQVRLSNNNNYLAIVQGCITIMPLNPGVPRGPESKFQLSQMGSFVTLECVADKGKYIGFLHTGQPKLPCGVRKEIDTQFSIKLLSTGYPVVGHQ